MARMQHIGGGIYSWGPTRSLSNYQLVHDQGERLLSLDLKAANKREIVTGLNDFAAGYLTRQIKIHDTNSFTAFRASRPTSPERGETWCTFKELWAPEAKHVKHFGRFNEPGKPTLYVSADPLTALAETGASFNEFRVLLVLRRRVQAGPMVFSQLGSDRFPTYGFMREAMAETSGGLKNEPILQRLLNDQGVQRYWDFQDTKLADISSRYYENDEAQERYRLTFLIGQQLQSIASTSGFQYPSTAVDYKGFNIALPVNLARRHLQPLEAWLVSLGPDPQFVAMRPTDPREPVVIRRGIFDGGGRIKWGDDGWWPIHALHRTFAPHPNFDIWHH